jgi:hypothetical protein
VEELHVSALEIEGLTLVPTRYREDVNEGTITATFVTEVSDEERLDELLTKTHEFFDVIRRGISDEPLRMRFGRRVWQQAGDGTRRHNLVLIADEDKSRAAPDPLSLANQPQLDRTMEKACANTNALTLLLEELQSKGVLDKDAFHAIKHAATARPLTHQEKSELSRTDRLDDYWR